MFGILFHICPFPVNYSETNILNIQIFVRSDPSFFTISNIGFSHTFKGGVGPNFKNRFNIRKSLKI